MNFEQPPPYYGPGPNPGYAPQGPPPQGYPGGPNAGYPNYPPGPAGPYPAPGQPYPQQPYGWQNAPQPGPVYGEGPKNTVYIVEDRRQNDAGDSCLTACWTALCCCCLWDMLT
ncbi:cysteine-rich and transmembrane domain-containing protein 1-like [Denticeps clupeoides]|uniref:Cysteine-rich and transmembrane domain-containing protein 1 n=1 Tax=Denticeps clupeoides TaxID=299321 RepID=A0AAY4DDF6_9TELE|nr:cysteine-rich and transmembrane domain-containing protein 1-like [Denticeps clupeoides]